MDENNPENKSKIRTYNLVVTYHRPEVKTWRAIEFAARATSLHEAKRRALQKYLTLGYQVKSIFELPDD